MKMCMHLSEIYAARMFIRTHGERTPQEVIKRIDTLSSFVQHRFIDMLYAINFYYFVYVLIIIRKVSFVL